MCVCVCVCVRLVKNHCTQSFPTILTRSNVLLGYSLIKIDVHWTHKGNFVCINRVFPLLLPPATT